MRILYSILISFAVLSGSVGMNFLESQCICCGIIDVCECGSSCETMEVVETDPVSSCCSSEDYGCGESSGCCSSGCCTPEYIKLEIPLILVFTSIKVETPEIELFADIPVWISGIYNSLVFKETLKVPDEPPSITRSGLDLFSAFLC